MAVVVGGTKARPLSARADCDDLSVRAFLRDHVGSADDHDDEVDAGRLVDEFEPIAGGAGDIQAAIRLADRSEVKNSRICAVGRGLLKK
jgi:hypothetical protein